MNSTNGVLHLLQEASGNGITVFLEEGKVKLKVAQDRKIEPAFLGQLKDRKEEIKVFLLEENKHKESINQVSDEIKAFDRAEIEKIPLSFAQERLWFIDQLEGSIHYHIPMLLKFKGNLDVDALEQAFSLILQRHEVLRTVFKSDQGLPFQEIIPAEGWQMDFIKDIGIDQLALDALVRWESEKMFDLSRDYMFRATLIQTGREAFILLMVVHHIASDGWSEGIFTEELAECYLAIKENRSPNLPDLPIQYADYAVWQREFLQGDRLEQKLAYWQDQLDQIEPLDLPTDHPRPATQSTKGNSIHFKIDAHWYQKVQHLCQREQVTPFMFLLAVFKVLLYRYSGQNDITVGTPIANREQPELDALIGFFVNTLVLRSIIDGASSFQDFLKAVREMTLQAYANQEVPFEKLVEQIVHDRELSRSPLFQVLFIFQNAPEAAGGELEDMQLTEETYEDQVAKFDQTWTVVEHNGGIAIDLNFCTALFKEESMQQMAKHFETLIQAIVSNPLDSIDELDLITSNEKRQLLSETQAQENIDAVPSKTTLLELLATQIQAHPDEAAMIFKDEKLTYRQLDELTNGLAAQIVENGTDKKAIAICLDYSFEMLIAMVGILKAGCAYVPIDPTYPNDRIDYILNDIQADLVVTAPAYQSLFTKQSQLTTLLLNKEEVVRATALTNLPSVEPSDLAYIIYTSGSTGMPKGVMVPHSAIANELAFYSKYFEFKVGDRQLLLANFVFDASVEQIFLPLVSGSTLVMITRAEIIEPQLLERAIDENGITHFQATPSLIQTITPRSYTRLKRVCSGGEACPTSLAKAWSPFVEFYNKYGPTEAAVNVSCHLFQTEKAYSETLPIGNPIDNARLYVLDQNLQLIPPGLIGELYIGGIGVSKGYLNRPKLTTERFLDSPFVEGERLYKTGDRVRMLTDGNLEFRGRMDDQVKIRGYRIELGEIEANLMSTAMLKACAVATKPSASGDLRLIAYVVSKEEFDKERMEDNLRDKLPTYMHPSLIIELDEIPLTTSGKVNRKLLPQPKDSDFQSEDFVAPRNDLERNIAEVWKHFLGLNEVSIHADFFRLGGHSLLAMRVVSAIQIESQLNISVGDLFRNPTIAGLAALAGQLPSAPLQSIQEQLNEKDLARVAIEDDF